MARIAEELKFTINIGQGEDNPVLVLRQPTEKEIQDFLSSRIARIGKQIVDQTIKAKVDLINTLLIDCDKIEIAEAKGQWIALTPATENWKEKILVNWKSSVGNYFEEREVFTEADEKK